RGDYLSILKLISIYILAISGFNYIYFSHTRIVKNSVQYGIRKVFGAKPGALFQIFLAESVFIHLMAVALFVAAYSVLKGTLFSILPEMNPVTLPGRFW